MDGDAAVLACAVWAAVRARRAGGMEYVLTPTFGPLPIRHKRNRRVPVHSPGWW